MQLIYDDVILKYAPFGGVAVYWNELLERARQDYPDLIRIPLHSHSYYPYVINLLRRARAYNKFSQKPVFHSSYYRLPDFPAYNVVTVHDFTIDKFATLPRKLIHQNYKFKAIRSADAIICISDSTKNDLLEFLDVDIDKISVIPHGVSKFFYKLNMPIQDYVLYVGKRSGYKNFDLAVKAISLNKRLNLLVLGGGDLSLVEQNKLSRYVYGRWSFIKSFNEEQLRAYYSSAFALLYPSNYEGFGLPVLEAMACGCPVICQKKSSLNEVGGEAALYCENNPFHMNELLEELYDKAYRQKIVSIGLKNSKRFNWDETYRKTKSIYDKLSSNN